MGVFINVSTVYFRIYLLRTGQYVCITYCCTIQTTGSQIMSGCLVYMTGNIPVQLDGSYLTVSTVCLPIPSTTDYSIGSNRQVFDRKVSYRHICIRNHLYPYIRLPIDSDGLFLYRKKVCLLQCHRILSVEQLTVDELSVFLCIKQLGFSFHFPILLRQANAHTGRSIYWLWD